MWRSVVALITASVVFLTATPVVAQSADVDGSAGSLESSVFVQGAPLVGGTSGLFFDPDNNLWTTQTLGGTLTKLNPETGEILEQLTGADGIFAADDVTVGDDGTLYWTEIAGGTVFRRSPGGPSEPLFPFGAVPSANPLTLGDDGRLFYAQCYNAAGTNGVFELDLDTMVTRTIIEDVPGCGSNAMDFARDAEGNAVLYSPRPLQDRVVRIDVATGEITDVTTGWAAPIAVKIDSKGNVWAGNDGVVGGDPGQIVRIDIDNPDTSANRTVVATLPSGWIDNLAFDKDDRLYVSSYTDADVREVLADGTFRTVSPGNVTLMSGVEVHDGTVYTTSFSMLTGFDTSTGNEVSRIRSVFGVGPLPPVTGVAAWGDNLVLTSIFAPTLLVWDPATGTPVLSAEFGIPADAVPFGDDLIVTEIATGNVVRASGPDLATREVIATLTIPSGLEASGDNLYVSDAGTGEVLQIIADGAVLSPPVAIADGLNIPEGLAFGSDHDLLVVEGGAQTLTKIDINSGETETLATDLGFGTPIPGVLPFSWFNNVAVDEYGNIYVNADAVNVIHKFTEVRDGCDPDSVSRSNRVWTVTPNGYDDTANVACAIAEATENFPDGTPTIRLERGTFHLDFLFAEGFHGRIVGASRTRTTIEPLDGGLDCKSAFEQFGFVAWLAFADSDVRMRDLSLSIPDVACAEPYFEDVQTDPDTGEESGFRAQDFNAMVVVATRVPAPTDTCEITANAGLVASRLNVDAPQPDFSTPVFHPKGAFNTFFVVGTQPVNCDASDATVGDVIVRHVSARGVGNLIQAQSITDATIRVRNNHTVGVDVPIILADNERSTAKVMVNDLEGVTGVGIVSDNCTGPSPTQCQQDSSTVRIFNNDIAMAPGSFAGVVAVDGRQGSPQVDARIFRNDITSDGNVAGVFVDGADGDRVARNTFDGASVFGVLVDGATTKSKIVSNDMTDHVAFDVGIQLGELTSSNLVRRNRGATVRDLGTDNDVDVDVDTIAAAALSLLSLAAATTAVELDQIDSARTAALAGGVDWIDSANGYTSYRSTR